MSVADAAADWRPSASLAAIRLRAQLLARTRQFFAARQVLEVETPLLGRAGVTDVNLQSISARVAGIAPPLYLQTSPEYAMKRLLAAGAPDIYQICKAFRDGERGRHHNPEFTIVEWYRLGFDAAALMQEVEDLLCELLGRARIGAAQRISYNALLERELGLHPLHSPVTELARVAEARLGPLPEGVAQDRDLCLDLLMGAVLGPTLGQGQLLFVHGYPASQAALARLNPAEPATAERFEAYLGGLELCNGFHELTDPVEQRARFARDGAGRLARGLPPAPIDNRLLGALAAGLPDCAGVALGFDRVLLLAADAKALGDVLSFPIERA